MPKGGGSLAYASETGRNCFLSHTGHMVGVKPPEAMQRLLGAGREWPDKSRKSTLEPFAAVMV